MRESQISPTRNLKWDLKSNTAEVYKGTEDIMYNSMQVNLKVYFSGLVLFTKTDLRKNMNNPKTIKYTELVKSQI